MPAHPDPSAAHARDEELAALLAALPPHCDGWGLGRERLARALHERLVTRLGACEASPRARSRAGWTELIEHTRLDDLALALAWQAGSEQAWAAFGPRFRADLLRVAQRQGADRREAERIVDGLPGDLFGPDSALAAYHGRGSLSSWLAVIVRRRVIDGIRRRGREADLDCEPSDPAPTPVAVSVGEETARRLDAALTPLIHRLTPRERSVLLLKYHQGLSGRTIARALGISDSRVTRLAQRAFTKLSESLREAFPDGEPQDFGGLEVLWERLSFLSTERQIPAPPRDPSRTGEAR